MPNQDVGDQLFMTATGEFEGGTTDNITQKVVYSSTDTGVALAPNTEGFKSRVTIVGPGTVDIVATDPITGVRSDDPGCDGNSTITVDPPPSPTPSGTPTPTSTGPTGTPTLSATPTPTATPGLVRIELRPATRTISINQPGGLGAFGHFEDGSERNLTQQLVYSSDQPGIVEALNLEGNASRIIGRAPGVAIISATHVETGVTSSGDDNSVITVREGPAFTPSPVRTTTPSPTPVLDALGDPAEAKAANTCAKNITKGSSKFAGKKLQGLARCANAIYKCLQTKPGDQKCLDRAGSRCTKQLAKIATAEAKFASDVVRRCSTFAPSSLTGALGLAYDNVAATCDADFGARADDAASVAVCLAAQHTCRLDETFETQVPRIGELLGLVGVPLGLDSCFADFGGPGTDVDDPKGLGKTITKCQATIEKSGTRYATKHLKGVTKCLDALFACIQTKPRAPSCLIRATTKCNREYARIDKEADKFRPAIDKRCLAIDFATLEASAGTNLDALDGTCAAVGITALTSLASYEECLFRQHICAVEELLRFASPRIDELLALVGRDPQSEFCPSLP